MGWWETDNADDLIGDAPADILQKTLRGLAKGRKKQGKKKPTLHEELSALMTVLETHKAALLEAGEDFEIRELRAIVEPGPETISARAESTDPDLVDVLLEALEAVTQEYEESVERRPRLSEVLSCFTFVWGHEPKKYLSGVKGKSITSITAELA